MRGSSGTLHGLGPTLLHILVDAAVLTAEWVDLEEASPGCILRLLSLSIHDSICNLFRFFTYFNFLSFIL